MRISTYRRASAFLLAISLLLWSFAGSALADDPTRKAVPQSGPSEVVLPNGLRVIVLEDHSYPLVSCLSWYRVGARNETPGFTGMSHLLEHLLFGEVGSFRPGEIAAQIARNGGQFNGYTSDDFTTFFETLPSAKLELALKIEAERMRQAVFTEQALKDEVLNVQHEFDNEALDGGATLARQVRALLFLTHPYHNATLGWRADLDNIKIEDLKRYYDRYYKPNNCTLVIAGDVRAALVAPMVQKYFAAYPRGSDASGIDKPIEPEQKGERRVVVKYAGKQEALQVSYRAPAFDDPDAPALVVLERLLTCPYGGRLKTRLINNKICAQASASFEAKKDPGMFSITCQANSSSHDEQKICDAIDDLVQQLKSQPISDAEMRRARNQAELAFYTEQDGPYRAGFLLGYFDTLCGWQKAASWDDRLRAVTAADIQRVAGKYFNQDSRVVAWLSSSQPRSTPGVKPAGSATDKNKPVVQMTGYKPDDSSLSPSKRQQFRYIVSRQPEPPQEQKLPEEKKQPAVQRVIEEIPDVLPASVRDLPQVVEKVPAVIKSIPSAIGGIPGKIKELSAAVNSLPSAVKAIPGAVGSIPGAAVSAVKELPSAAATTIKELPGALGAMPGATVNAVKGMPAAIGSVAAQIGTVPGAIGKQLTQEKTDKSGLYKKVLKNGVRVVVFESHLTPLVQITGAFHAGAAYDPPAQSGTSAVAAAMLNQGTAARARGVCLQQQEDMGLAPFQMLRFQSNPETINFSAACLSRDLTTELGLLAETLRTPAIQDSDLERAKQDAAGQLKQADDSLESRAQTTFVRNALADASPFALKEPVAVTKSIASLDNEAVRSFVKQHIVPQDTTIVIAGDVQPERAVAALESALSGWSGKAPPSQLHARANSKHILRAAVPVKDKSRAVLAYGQLLPVAATSADYANLLICDALLSKHPVFSRVNRALAGDEHLLQLTQNESCQSRLDNLSNLTAWYLMWSVPNEAVSSVAATMQNELRKLAADGIKPDELAEMKHYLLGALPTARFSSLAKAADCILQSSLSSEDGDGLPAQLAAIQAATPDSVNKFIKTTLSPQSPILVVVGSPQAIKAARTVTEAGNAGSTSTSTHNDALPVVAAPQQPASSAAKPTNAPAQASSPGDTH